MKLCDIVKEITDVITLHGEWDGQNHYALMSDNLKGACELNGRVVDVYGVYVMDKDIIPLAVVNIPNENRGLHLTLNRLPQEVVQKIYDEVMNLWHED